MPSQCHHDPTSDQHVPSHSTEPSPSCEAERRYQVLTGVITDVTFELSVNDPAGVDALWISGSLADLTGYTPEEWRTIGGWPAVVHPDHLDAGWEAIRRVQAAEPIRASYRIITKQQQVRWLQLTMEPRRGPAGDVRSIVGSVQDVTDTKEVEERWRALAELAQEFAVEVRFDGDGDPIVTWSMGMERAAGYTPDEVEARGGPHSAIHPDDAQAYRRRLADLKAGRSCTDILRAIGSDGETRWLQLRATPIVDPLNGTVVGARTVGIDVSDLKDSERRWAELSQLTADVTYSFHLEDDGPVVDWVAGDHEALLGCTFEEAQELGGWRHFVHPDDVNRLEDRNRRLASGKADETELRVLTAHREVRWVRLTTTPRVTPDGTIQVLGSARDITEARKAQERWAALARLTSDLAYEARLGDRGEVEIVWQSDAVSALTGYSTEELDTIGGWPAVVVPSDHRSVEDCLERLRHGVRDDRELQLRVKDGTVKWVRALAHPIVDDLTGAVTGFLGALSDVTAEHEARSLDRHLAAVAAASADAIYTRDAQGRVVSWNEAARRIYGYAAEDMLGETIAALEPPERRGETTELFVGALQGREVVGFETTRLTKDGHIVDVALTITPVRDGRGQITAVATVARDITTTKETMTRLGAALDHERTAAKRLEEADAMKDRFITAVSHELRTPLTPIIGFAATVRDRDRELDDGVRSEMLDGIVRNAEELSRMVENLLETVQLGIASAPVNLKPVDVRRVVVDVLAGAGPEFAHHQWLLDLEPVEVLANVDALRVVLRNLCSNAVKYSHDSTLVTLSARTDGDEVVFQVTDQGGGIDPEIAELVFEPFAQAAEQPSGHHGLGVGLYAARSYVTLMGGRMWVESSSDAGAALAFTLPLAAQTNEASTPANNAMASPGIPQA